MPLFSSEAERLAEFPITRDSIFLAHAGVTILPARVTKVMQDYLQEACTRMQEFPEAWRATNETRAVAAKMLGERDLPARPDLTWSLPGGERTRLEAWR
jgi:selenocysteine lyase/cysteine desulfurase